MSARFPVHTTAVSPLFARTALALGAGGPVGRAYHAGVLAALHHVFGWDSRCADLIVGTSAGAHVGAFLRAGVAPGDLLAWAQNQPLEAAAERIIRHWVRPRPRPGRSRMLPASPSYLASAVIRPWRVRPGRLVAAMLPEGNVCLKPHAEGWRRIFGGAWPTNLWIAAVRLHDGQLVAFGTPDAPAVDVGTAVACSSAVPFVCAAVRVGPQRFIDGGIASATNLRLLAPVPTLSTVIVSSPLSRMPGMAARLRGEIGWLRRHGLEVIAFEPGPRTARAMGWNPLCWERGVRVAREAYAETVALLSDRAHPHRKAFERLMANHSEPESAMV